MIESIDIVKPLLSDAIGVESSVGYLRSDDSVHFNWHCHEAVTQPDAIITPRYTENSAGLMVAIVGDLAQAGDPGEGLYWSADGCDWNVASGASGQQVKDVELSPLDDSLGIFVTSNGDGSGGIYRTEDAGQTWNSTEVQYDDRSFRTVRFARGEAGSIWVAAIQREPLRAWIYRSVDSGLSWEEHEVEVPEDSDPFTYLDVVAVDADDPLTAWFVMGPYLDDRLLKTTDGGASLVEVFSIERDIIDGAQDENGDLWLVLSGNSIVLGSEDDVFEELRSAPMSLGVETDADTVMLATRVLAAGGPLASSRDGRSFEVNDAFSVLSPLTHCSTESHYVASCLPLWSELESKVGASSQDTGDTGFVGAAEATDDHSSDQINPSGCCRSHTKQSGAALMVLLVFALRRRHLG